MEPPAQDTHISWYNYAMKSNGGMLAEIMAIKFTIATHYEKTSRNFVYCEVRALATSHTQNKLYLLITQEYF